MVWLLWLVVYRRCWASGWAAACLGHARCAAVWQLHRRRQGSTAAPSRHRPLHLSTRSPACPALPPRPVARRRPLHHQRRLRPLPQPGAQGAHRHGGRGRAGAPPCASPACLCSRPGWLAPAAAPAGNTGSRLRRPPPAPAGARRAGGAGGALRRRAQGARRAPRPGRLVGAVRLRAGHRGRLARRLQAPLPRCAARRAACAPGAAGGSRGGWPTRPASGTSAEERKREADRSARREDRARRRAARDEALAALAAGRPLPPRAAAGPGAGTLPPAPDTPVAFLFPGQGSQAVRGAAWDACANGCLPWAGWSPSEEQTALQLKRPCEPESNSPFCPPSPAQLSCG
jgi:hypothetical protein